MEILGERYARKSSRTLGNGAKSIRGFQAMMEYLEGV